MELKLIVAFLSSCLSVSCGVIPLTAPKLSSIRKDTHILKFHPKQNSINRLARPRFAPTRAQSMNQEYGGFFDDPVPEKVDYFPVENSKFTDNTVVPKSYNPNVPRSEGLIYSGILQVFNGAYFYAINALNVDLSIGYPGILRFSDPKIYDHEVQKLYRRALYGKTGRESCEALNKLLVLDGLVPVSGISTEQLSAPTTHYIAAIVQDREPAMSNQGRPYEPKYFRLNAGGVWSYKIGMEANQGVDHQPFTSSSEASRELTRIAMLTTGREDIKGRFCGFFEVTKSMRYNLEARVELSKFYER